MREDVGGHMDKLEVVAFTGHGRTEPQAVHLMCRAIWREE